MSDQQSNTSNPYKPPSAAVSEIPTGTGAMAGRGTRLGAALLDGIIFGVAVYGPFVAGGLFPALVASMTGKQALVWSQGLFLWGSLAGVMFLVICAVTFVLVKRNGQTIGKKILGIKVVRKDGSRASVARIFWLRNFINIVISMVPFVRGVYGLVDVLLIFGQARQCVHDKIADTIVIRA